MPGRGNEGAVLISWAGRHLGPIVIELITAFAARWWVTVDTVTT